MAQGHITQGNHRNNTANRQGPTTKGKGTGRLTNNLWKESESESQKTINARSTSRKPLGKTKICTSRTAYQQGDQK